MPPLPESEIRSRLAGLPGWSIVEGLLTKTYTVRSFAHAVLFIGAIGHLAEAANHHPDLRLHGYQHVTIALETHSEGGLTAMDFNLATAIEALPQKALKKD
jgi:4a-hydroxytetrahydrobiopterin dehydratase